MKRIVSCLFLVIIIVGYNHKSKKNNSNNVREIKQTAENSKGYYNELESSNHESNDSHQQYYKCDSIWKSHVEREKNIDSLIKSKVTYNPKISITNKTFILALLKNSDSLLKIERPLSAVFQGLDSVPFIISNYSWMTKSGFTKKFAVEQKILKKHDTVSYNPENEEGRRKFIENWEARKYFPRAAIELSQKTRTLYIYSKNRTHNSKVNAIGVQNSECDGGYVFYNFDYENYSDNLLIASPYILELEFGNWSKIDSIIQNQSIYDCYDCPHSNKLVKTFAKLKGVNNFYLTYVGEKNNITDLDTPSRSLVYIDKSNHVYDIWYDEIDLFGCACL